MSSAPVTSQPATIAPSSGIPTTLSPSTAVPTTHEPTTKKPSTLQPTLIPTETPTFHPSLAPTYGPASPDVVGSLCMEGLYIHQKGVSLCFHHFDCKNFTLIYSFPLGGVPGFNRNHTFPQTTIPYLDPNDISCCSVNVGVDGVFCEADDYFEWEFYPKSNGGYYLGFSIIILSMFVCLCAGGFLFYFRDRPIIRMSQLNFTLLFLFGLLLVNVSFVLVIDSLVFPTSQACIVSYLMIGASSTLMASSLLMKEIRALRLHTQAMKLRKVNFPDNYLYIAIAAITGVVLILLSMSVVFEHPTPRCGRKFCEITPLVGSVFTIVGLLFIALLVLVYLAWNVSDVAAESKGVFVTVLNILVATLVVFIVSVSTSLDINGLAVLYSVYFLEITSVGVYCIIFRRAWSLQLTQNEVVGRFVKAATTEDKQDIKKSSNRFNLRINSADQTACEMPVIDRREIASTIVEEISPKEKSLGTDETIQEGEDSLTVATI